MPRRVVTGVGIVGLDEFRRDLRAFGQSVPRLLGQANHDVAQLGAERAKAAAEAQGSTARHVAPSIRSGYAARYAYVALGSEAFPMALGAEFGSKRFHQFRPWVGNQWETGASDEGGYFMGPALRAAEPQMLAEYTRLLDAIERAVFNER